MRDSIYLYCLSCIGFSLDIHCRSAQDFIPWSCTRSEQLMRIISSAGLLIGSERPYFSESRMSSGVSFFSPFLLMWISAEVQILKVIGCFQRGYIPPIRCFSDPRVLIIKAICTVNSYVYCYLLSFLLYSPSVLFPFLLNICIFRCLFVGPNPSPSVSARPPTVLYYGNPNYATF